PANEGWGSMWMSYRRWVAAVGEKMEPKEPADVVRFILPEGADTSPATVMLRPTMALNTPPGFKARVDPASTVTAPGVSSESSLSPAACPMPAETLVVSAKDDGTTAGLAGGPIGN